MKKHKPPGHSSRSISCISSAYDIWTLAGNLQRIAVMITDKDIRVDKWLWAVRVFKTRSAASEACRKGKVLVNNSPVKPSRALKINDVVSVRRQPVLFSYKVRGLLGKRLSARLITEYVENITPASELEKLRQAETFFVQRDKGSGRPTKKERRKIDKIQRRF